MTQSAKKYHTSSEKKQSSFSLKVVPLPNRPNKQHITDEIKKTSKWIKTKQKYHGQETLGTPKGKYASSCHTFDI